MRYSLVTVSLIWALGCLSPVMGQGGGLSPGGFGGPSMLDRIGSGGGGPALVRIRPFLTLNSFYENGLTPAATEPNQSIPSYESAGVSASFGAYGFHEWRRSVLGLAYQGRARHYTDQQRFDGIDQSLNLYFSQAVTQRFSYALNQSAGLYNRGLGLGNLTGFGGQSFGFNATPVPGEALNVLPEDDVVDTRTMFLSSSAQFQYALSRHFSVNGGATGFAVRRKAEGLAGITGYGAQGGIGRRLSRRQTIGLGYQFFHYEYTRGFGFADIHAIAAEYDVAVGRNWQIGVRAGVARMDRTGLVRIRLDPVVAAILGQPTGVEIRQGVTYGGIGSVYISRQFRRAGASAGYNRYVTPGNGLFLLSQAERIFASYGYRGIRNWNINFRASHNRYIPQDMTTRKYRGYTLGVGVSRRIVDWLGFASSFSWRRADIGVFNRDAIQITAGLSFQPGDFPLTFW